MCFKLRTIFLFSSRKFYIEVRGKKDFKETNIKGYWNQEHSHHYIVSTGDTLFRHENIFIILSPFILVTWSKSTIPFRNSRILKVCLISSLLLAFKFNFAEKNFICKEKHIINKFKTSSQANETVSTFSINFPGSCP